MFSQQNIKISLCVCFLYDRKYTVSDPLHRLIIVVLVDFYQVIYYLNIVRKLECIFGRQMHVRLTLVARVLIQVVLTCLNAG